MGASGSFAHDSDFKGFNGRKSNSRQDGALMPRGGARVGSGRKPKDGKAIPFAPAAVDGGRAEEISPVPPADLPMEQQDFWRTYAKPAIEARTLTSQTVGAFRLLCELDAEKQATKATIDRDGRTYIKAWTDSSGQEHQELKAHPLTSAYRQLAQRVEALMGRFGLAPFGKPVAEKPQRGRAANPWARIVGQR
jgi:phage terminase small subunit